MTKNEERLDLSVLMSGSVISMLESITKDDEVLPSSVVKYNLNRLQLFTSFYSEPGAKRGRSIVFVFNLKK